MFNLIWPGQLIFIWPWQLIFKQHRMLLFTLSSRIEVWTRFEPREEKSATDKHFTIILLWSSHLNLKIGSRSLHTRYLKALFRWSMSQTGLSWIYWCMIWKISIFAWLDMTLDLQTSFKVTTHPLTIYTPLWVKYEPYLTKWRTDSLRTRVLFILLLWP